MEQMDLFGNPVNVSALVGRKSVGLKRGQCRIVGTVFPDGQFSVGFSHGRDGKELTVEKDCYGNDVGDLEDDCPVELLGLSSVPNSHTPLPERKKRGFAGITRYGRLMVSNGCWMLDTPRTKGRICLFTGTLPPMSRDDNMLIASQWSEVIRQFNQSVARNLRKRGLSGLIVGVTEIQPKRLQNSEDCGLHYHCVFQGKKTAHNAPWELSCTMLREFWRNAVVNALGHDVNDDFGRSTRVESVKHDIGGYLSKYLSKGSEVLQLYLEKGFPPPASWWSMSVELKGAIARFTVKGEKVGKQLWSDVRNGEFYIKRAREIIWQDGEGNDVLVGYVGMCERVWLGACQPVQIDLMIWKDKTANGL